MWRSGTATGGGVAGEEVVAVAVDADKNSQHALKWAADHAVPRGRSFFLIHVRRKITTIPTRNGNQIPISEVPEDVSSAFIAKMAQQTKELLLPFQCFCSRRGLQCKEIILDDMDIPKAIADFVLHQTVDKLVMGASTRNSLMRNFVYDVPTSVSKIAPDFCSIYVISKAKISSVRTAPQPHKYPVNRPALNVGIAGNSFQSTKSEPDTRCHIEAVERPALLRAARVGYDTGNELPERSYDNTSSGVHQVAGHPGFPCHSISSCPSPIRTSTDRPSNYHSRDFLEDGVRQNWLPNMHSDCPYGEENLKSFYSIRTGGAYWSNSSGSSAKESGTSCSGLSTEDEEEAEMTRLKLELRLKMEMIEGSREQADLLKVAGELSKREASLAEEMELDSAQKEKQNSRTSFETSQAAQKMVMMSANRMNGERNMFRGVADEGTVPNSLSSNLRYRRYSTEEIKQATNNFSDALKIGEGGYGPVFKSTLDHTPVAIKILRTDTAQGMKQFQQEVQVLSCIRHPNMVLLMGACPEYGCLVYEYMANGSLEDRLFCRSNTPPLSWQLRFKIAAEIATGLLFLHQNKPEPLVHRDLKPANILLDHNFVSKIADVGLARLIPPSAAEAASQYCMTAAAGTFCYIDPEYQKTGMLGIKSDIYAFGMILLQLITAAPPMGLAPNIDRAIEMGKLEEMLDPSVPQWPTAETLKLAKLALKCTELLRKDRPELGSVVLPELNKLRVFADSTQATAYVPRHHQPRNYNR